ncbi:MAG TPA: hypothetical protein GX696_02010 [Pseudomonadaceae bacterium]|nr:hypothetical protein [Pseudomonadaceae bacterium]
MLFYTAKTPQLYNNTIGAGYLPCPDVDNDGLADANSSDGLCPGTTLGRLPESVQLPGSSNFFSLSDTDDESNQQLWYAVAAEHVYDETHKPAEGRLSATPGRLSLNGKPGYVALIIAPGAALPGQSRTPNSDEQFTPGNYLEGANSDSDTLYENLGSDPDAFNDRILGISHDELMRYAGMSVAQHIGQEILDECSADGSGCPAAGLLDMDGSTWLAAELWQVRIGYRDDEAAANPFLEFDGCPGMSFTLHPVVSREGDKCHP